MDEKKPICIIVDTNIWCSSLLLKSEFGPALLHVLKRCNGKLGIPEIIELEVPKQIIKRGKAAISNIEQGFREVGAIIGSHSPYEVPSENDIVGKIHYRFRELDDLIERVEMNMIHVRSAINRINSELPPNGPKNQQFKDSMIWEAALELSKEFSVHLVTKDGGFYKRGEQTEIAPELKEECTKRGAPIYVHRELRDCIKYLRDEIPDIDYDILSMAIKIRIEHKLREDAASHLLDIGELLNFNIDAFYTENHDILALGYDLLFNGIDISSDDNNPKLSPIIIAKGDCKYSMSKKTAENISIQEIDYKWANTTGLVEKRSVRLYAGTVHIGRQPNIPYTIKKPIQELS